MTLLVLLLRHLRRGSAAVLLLLAAVAILAGAAAFSSFESVSFGTGLYWAITTATTVGYGDVTPHNTAGRVVATVEMLTAIPLFAGVFATVTASASAIRLRRLLEIDRRLPAPGYVVIFGAHPLVPRVARELVDAGRSVVVVAPGASVDALPDGVRAVAGDPTSEDVVRRAEPGRAERALVATEEEGDALVAAVLIRHVAPALPVTALVRSEHVAHALADLGVEQALSADELVAHLLAKSLESPHAPELVRGLMDSERFVLREVPTGPEQVGRSIADLRAEGPGLLLGYVHGGRVEIGVDGGQRLAAGDRLLVLEQRVPADGKGGS